MKPFKVYQHMTDAAMKRLAAEVDAKVQKEWRYFDQNPLSQMGVIVTLNQTAHKLTDLSANPRRHIQVRSHAL